MFENGMKYASIRIFNDFFIDLRRFFYSSGVNNRYNRDARTMTLVKWNIKGIIYDKSAMRIAISIDSDAERMESRMNRVSRSAKHAQINGKDYLLKIYLEYFL